MRENKQPKRDILFLCTAIFFLIVFKPICNLSIYLSTTSLSESTTILREDDFVLVNTLDLYFGDFYLT